MSNLMAVADKLTVALKFGCVRVVPEFPGRQV